MKRRAAAMVAEWLRAEGVYTVSRWYAAGRVMRAWGLFDRLVLLHPPSTPDNPSNPDMGQGGGTGAMLGVRVLEAGQDARAVVNWMRKEQAAVLRAWLAGGHVAAVVRPFRDESRAGRPWRLMVFPLGCDAAGPCLRGFVTWPERDGAKSAFLTPSARAPSEGRGSQSGVLTTPLGVRPHT